ncbi:MAG: hypothetical protein ACRDN9_06445 [Streptosporangiaceae bacterium]
MSQPQVDQADRHQSGVRRSRSGKVHVTNRFDGVHPQVLAIADDLAGGDRRRIKIVSPTHLEVTQGTSGRRKEHLG